MITCVHCGHRAPKIDMVKSAQSLHFPGKWTCRKILDCMNRKYDRDKAAGVI